MITREQKNEILFLVSEIISLEKDLSFELSSEYGDDETYYELVKSIDKAENDLETYLENLTKD
ncbi:hypothetical protein KMC07_gp106 [Escherichia phage vB_EcoM_G8]|uniref:Uncharacterized protein n=1 Tax=Escherichia phage vB_EcoM_G8 TaxID=2508179 RepID=A0A482N0S5_9CAUD|nr:hypothetical protein KMC07_gp106 [Escherichia phage vB_EcoM_G8]QBQ79991.1 hypothetical protein G8_00107 [Escherichia phage vB_EcoM_G8]